MSSVSRLPTVPRVWRGAALNWVARKKWSLEFLESEFGKEEVLVTDGEGDFKRIFVCEYTDYLREKRGNLYWSPQSLNGKFAQLRDDYPAIAVEGMDPSKCVLRQRPWLFHGVLNYLRDFQWLFVGPAGSKTRCHVDPVGSCAWNAVLSGTKIFRFVKIFRDF